MINYDGYWYAGEAPRGGGGGKGNPLMILVFFYDVHDDNTPTP